MILLDIPARTEEPRSEPMSEAMESTQLTGKPRVEL